MKINKKSAEFRIVLQYKRHLSVLGIIVEK